MLVLRHMVDVLIEPATLRLVLTAAERRFSHRIYTTVEAIEVKLDLPRGTVLKPGAGLTDADQTTWVKVVAQAEPVLTVSSPEPLQLLRAAYHLGNRHVPLQVTAVWLRLEPDPVLEHLLVEHLGLSVTAEIATFEPELGAYHHGH